MARPRHRKSVSSPSPRESQPQSVPPIPQRDSQRQAVSAPPQRDSRHQAVASLSAAAALSFLKDTKGVLTWSIQDLAKSLEISSREAEQAIAFLQAQGYVQPASSASASGAPAGVKKSSANASGASDWMTTAAGESVSGAKSPRFTRENVVQALAALKERIRQANKDPKSTFRITGAVAFGDFLLGDRARVQAADVGIRLASRGQKPGQVHSATEARAERAFLRQLRGKTALISVVPYADWMAKRSHLDLL